MNKFGDKLYVAITDEPIVYLYSVWGLTFVRRPVMGQNGIAYKFGIFFNSELETLQEQTTRTLETIKLRNQLAEADMQAELDSEMQAQGPLQIPLPFNKKSN